MIATQAFLGPGGKVVGIRVSGHAGYAEEGKDILCAAASMLMHVLEYGIRERMRIPCMVQTDPRGAVWDIRWSQRFSQRTEVYTDVVVPLFAMLANQYPDYIMYREEDVQ